jgi:YVTN family beta-propeller protein
MPQQRPKKQENVEGRIVVAQNIHWSVPEYLKNAIASPLARERQGAVDVLAHLYRSGNEVVREGVIHEATKLVNDDSKAVSAATELAFADFLSDRALGKREVEDRKDEGAVDRQELKTKTPIGGGKPDAETQDERGSQRLRELRHTERKADGEANEHLLPTNPTPDPPVVALASSDPTYSPASGSDGAEKSRDRDAGRRSKGWFGSRLMVVLAVAAVTVLAIAVSLVMTSVQRTSSSGGPAAPPTAAPSPAATTPAAPLAASFAVPIVTAVVPVGAQPLSVTVAPGGEYAYVANQGAGSVSVLDATTGAAVKTIPIDAGPPQFVAFSPDGRLAYVSVWSQDSKVSAVVVVDLATDAPIATIPVGTRPFALAVTPDGREIYVACHDSGSVFVLDAATNAVAAEIRVAANPHVVVFRTLFQLLMFLVARST